DIDRRSPRQIAAVALAANAVRQFARQHGAHAHLLDMRRLDLFREVLADFTPPAHDDFAGLGVLHILSRRSPQNALRQGGNDLAAVDFGLDSNSLLRAAV